MSILVCKECKSEEVELKTWVNPNTNEIGDIVSADVCDTWCRHCMKHVELVTKPKETKDE